MPAIPTSTPDDPRAVERFLALGQAYALLVDDAFFVAAPKLPRRGADVRWTLDIPANAAEDGGRLHIGAAPVMAWPACAGTGLDRAPCAGCRGSGRASGPGVAVVHVPAGTATGDVLVVPGAGEPGRGGAPSGDPLLAARVLDRDGRGRGLEKRNVCAMRILFLGDIVGRPGRSIVFERLRQVRRDCGCDLVVANGENASGGIGVTAKAARQLLDAGIDVLTGGNHTFRHKDVAAFMETEERMLRPANYPPGAPGRGWQVYRPKDKPPYAVINLLGRVFMQAVDCPFRAADAILAELPSDVRVRLVDFHAEATSEKKALAYYLDGRVSAVLGTHTHVQTADAQLLPRGTALLSDCGMTGPSDSALGMDPEEVIARFLTGLPARFTVSRAAPRFEGALLDVDAATGKVVTIAAWRHPENGRRQTEESP